MVSLNYSCAAVWLLLLSSAYGAETTVGTAPVAVVPPANTSDTKTPTVTHGETGPPATPQFAEIFMSDSEGAKPKVSSPVGVGGATNTITNAVGTEDLVAKAAATGQVASDNTSSAAAVAVGTSANAVPSQDTSKGPQINLGTSLLEGVHNAAEKMNLSETATTANAVSTSSETVTTGGVGTTAAGVSAVGSTAAASVVVGSTTESSTSPSAVSAVGPVVTAVAATVQPEANATGVVRSVGTEDLLAKASVISATSERPSVSAAPVQPAVAGGYGPPPETGAKPPVASTVAPQTANVAGSNDANISAATAVTSAPAGVTVQNSVGTEDLTAKLNTTGSSLGTNLLQGTINAAANMNLSQTGGVPLAEPAKPTVAGVDLGTNLLTGAANAAANLTQTGSATVPEQNGKPGGFNIVTGPLQAVLAAASDAATNVSASADLSKAVVEGATNTTSTQGNSVAATTVATGTGATETAATVTGATGTSVATIGASETVSTATGTTAGGTGATGTEAVLTAAGTAVTESGVTPTVITTAVASGVTGAGSTVETTTGFFTAAANETKVVNAIGTENILPNISASTTAPQQNDNLTLTIGTNVDNTAANAVGILPAQSQKETAGCAPMLQQFIGCAKDEVPLRMAKEKQEADGLIDLNIQKCFQDQSCAPPDFVAAVDADLEGSAKLLWQNLSTWWDAHDTDDRECVVKVFRGNFRERLQNCVRQNLTGFSIALSWGENKLSASEKAELKKRAEHRHKMDVAILKCKGKEQLVHNCIGEARKSLDKGPCDVRSKCAAGVTDPNCKNMWVTRFRNPICNCRNEVVSELAEPSKVQENLMVSTTCPGVKLPEIDLATMNRNVDLIRRIKAYIALFDNRDLSICDECDGVDFKKH